ncbi:Putative type III effector [Mycoavidus cysteinexigens]|uniref:Type III effector n=1 Tax=Mycoavidus cysteinexigens TaxID=1553431 RepID=A0A2Z6EVV2_9BURK|nr:hypothetical protein [Mycoavidus cysteinexigens]BBE09526.1 Putative type III effector [Mycoavidus cysteinexigens]GAM51711.1 hypothetical protein EBME_0174 [bacterium endosymbiont of Mortierella elongata FMR23-6]GLR01348.1 hypothetical protein GCM10007934_11600 [Mycoavidus cysteinexigens]
MGNGFVYQKKGDFPRLIYSRKDPGQDIPLPSSSSYTTFNPLRRPINLHQALKPKDLNLNLKEYGKKTQIVTEETMKHLKICSEVIAEVKNIMRYGAGNQLFSMLDTGGESAIRTEMSRESIRKAEKESSMGKIERKIKYAIQYQAGNCDETNAIVFNILQTKGLNAPLFSMADIQQDHAYTLIGDPRAREWGETNTVVVDAWPIYGTAYTLNKSRYNLKTNPEVTLVHPASTPTPESIKVHQTVNTDCVNQYLDHKSYPKVGNELVEFLYKKTHNPKTCLDKRVGTEDPSTRYRVKGDVSQTFDKISTEKLEKYYAIQKEAGKFIPNHPNWDIRSTRKSSFLSHLKSI